MVMAVLEFCSLWDLIYLRNVFPGEVDLGELGGPVDQWLLISNCSYLVTPVDRLNFLSESFPSLIFT